jgi:hypothetical protein
MEGFSPPDVHFVIGSLALADGTRSSSDGKTIIARSMHGVLADKRDWRSPVGPFSWQDRVVMASLTVHLFAGAGRERHATIRDSLKKRNCLLGKRGSK